jgi:apolipoprotein D and lipocalin family protein
MFGNLFRKPRRPRHPETVPQVDVARYCGTWYEIAAIPSRQENRCTNTKAEYTLARGGGKVLVRNSCTRGGKGASVKATAVPVPGSGNAKLIVTFFRLFKADYWVTGLADDYSWALVTNPGMTRCWVLSRTPYPGESVLAGILELAGKQGIDTSKIVRTVHD